MMTGILLRNVQMRYGIILVRWKFLALIRVNSYPCLTWQESYYALSTIMLRKNLFSFGIKLKINTSDSGPQYFAEHLQVFCHPKWTNHSVSSATNTSPYRNLSKIRHENPIQCAIPSTKKWSYRRFLI